MIVPGRSAYVVITLAALASVTACAGRPATATATDAIAVPVAATSTREPRAIQRLGPPEPSDAATPSGVETEKPAQTAPIPEPTVAKTQKWVKIYSGPSAKDIKPPKDPAKGSHNVELNATPSDQIGTYVTDGAGRTLYRFDNDSANPPKSTCNGDCAKVWPPLLIHSPGKIFPKGIDPKILGYVERADHTCQVTINGHPVYYFVTDNRPGDINGQGVNGTWFAVSPDGGKTRALPDSLSTQGGQGN
jgi:predicted lipoprotein with Yx(FWY)xxD motif